MNRGVRNRRTKRFHSDKSHILVANHILFLSFMNMSESLAMLSAYHYGAMECEYVPTIQYNMSHRYCWLQDVVLDLDFFLSKPFSFDNPFARRSVLLPRNFVASRPPAPTISPVALALELLDSASA